MHDGIGNKQNIMQKFDHMRTFEEAGLDDSEWGTGKQRHTKASFHHGQKQEGIQRQLRKA
jgi:hypothetical protein